MNPRVNLTVGLSLLFILAVAVSDTLPLSRIDPSHAKGLPRGQISSEVRPAAAMNSFHITGIVSLPDQTPLVGAVVYIQTQSPVSPATAANRIFRVRITHNQHDVPGAYVPHGAVMSLSWPKEEVHSMIPRGTGVRVWGRALPQNQGIEELDTVTMFGSRINRVQVLEIVCAYHPDERALYYVVPTTYFLTTDRQGKFSGNLSANFAAGDQLCLFHPDGINLHNLQRSDIRDLPVQIEIQIHPRR